MLWVKMGRNPAVSLLAEGAILRCDFSPTIMMEFLEVQFKRDRHPFTALPKFHGYPRALHLHVEEESYR
jgi:hypothetical protein